VRLIDARRRLSTASSITLSVIHIKGASYRWRQHADMIPENLRGIQTPSRASLRYRIGRGRPPNRRPARPAVASSSLSARPEKIIPQIGGFGPPLTHPGDCCEISDCFADSSRSDS
jgi:hypothetical protein